MDSIQFNSKILFHCTGNDGEANAMDIDDGNSSMIDSKKPIAQSLKVTAKAISDYYTKAEYTSFMKQKANKEKKLRKVRKKEEDLRQLFILKEEKDKDLRKKIRQEKDRLMKNRPPTGSPTTIPLCSFQNSIASRNIPFVLFS